MNEQEMRQAMADAFADFKDLSEEERDKLAERLFAQLVASGVPEDDARRLAELSNISEEEEAKLLAEEFCGYAAPSVG